MDKTMAGRRIQRAPVNIRTGSAREIQDSILLAELESCQKDLQAARDTLMAKYKKTKAKFPTGDSTGDMVARAVGEYFNKFTLDDAMDLFFWQYSCRKLQALVKSGFRVRPYDGELRGLRQVVAKLRK
jgi:hypothetical protein